MYYSSISSYILECYYLVIFCGYFSSVCASSNQQAIFSLAIFCAYFSSVILLFRISRLFSHLLMGLISVAIFQVSICQFESVGYSFTYFRRLFFSSARLLVRISRLFFTFWRYFSSVSWLLHITRLVLHLFGDAIIWLYFMSIFFSNVTLLSRISIYSPTFVVLFFKRHFASFVPVGYFLNLFWDAIFCGYSSRVSVLFCITRLFSLHLLFLWLFFKGSVCQFVSVGYFFTIRSVNLLAHISRQFFTFFFFVCVYFQKSVTLPLSPSIPLTFYTISFSFSFSVITFTFIFSFCLLRHLL